MKTVVGNLNLHQRIGGPAPPALFHALTNLWQFYDLLVAPSPLQCHAASAGDEDTAISAGGQQAILDQSLKGDVDRSATDIHLGSKGFLLELRARFVLPRYNAIMR
jgi:hypothetical protein